MADKPRPFAEDAFRKIMKIAELTADPARLPELSDGAAAVVNQFKADVAKLGAEVANAGCSCSSRRRPASVTDTLRVVRFSKRTPTRSSS